jgi:hypothetical protein
MNLLRILNVALASALFTFSPPASAAVSPSAALVTEARSRAEGPSNAGGGKAEQGIGQAPRANSDRLRSLSKRQAPRPRTAVAASDRGAASTTAPSRYAATNLSQGSASTMRNGAATRAAVAPPQNSAARTATLGGARAQEHARLGGPSLGKPTHATALDGTQLQRRKY